MPGPAAVRRIDFLTVATAAVTVVVRWTVLGLVPAKPGTAYWTRLRERLYSANRWKAVCRECRDPIPARAGIQCVAETTRPGKRTGKPCRVWQTVCRGCAVRFLDERKKTAS